MTKGSLYVGGPSRSRTYLQLAGVLSLLSLVVILYGAYDVYNSGQEILGQEHFGTLHGTVRNATDVPVEGVDVTVDGRHAVTDADGHYSVTCHTGMHTMLFSRPGYDTVSIRVFVLDAGEDDPANRVDLTSETGLYLDGPFESGPSGGNCTLTLINATGATAYLDGSRMNGTQFTGLKAGTHHIKVVLKNTTLKRDIAFPEANTTIDLDLNDTDPILVVKNGEKFNITVENLDSGKSVTLLGNDTMTLSALNITHLRIYAPGHIILNTSASGPGTFVVTRLKTTSTESISLAQPDDFNLCATMLVILSLFTLIGAVSAFLGRPIMLVYIGGAASIVDLVSPFYTSQILGGLIIILAWMAYKDKLNEKGGEGS